MHSLNSSLGRFDPRRFGGGQGSHTGSPTRKQVRFEQERPQSGEHPLPSGSSSSNSVNATAVANGPVYSRRFQAPSWIAIMAIVTYLLLMDGWVSSFTSHLPHPLNTVCMWWPSSWSMSRISPAALAKIDEAILRAQTPVALRDYALGVDGGMVFDELTSSGGSHTASGPDLALDEDTRVGRCWLFSGSTGQISITLPVFIYPTHVSIDHIPRAIAADIGQAPRRMILWGVIDGYDNKERHRRNIDQLQNNRSLERNHPTLTGEGYTFVELVSFVYDITQLQDVQTFASRGDMRDLGIDIASSLDHRPASTLPAAARLATVRSATARPASPRSPEEATSGQSARSIPAKRPSEANLNFWHDKEHKRNILDWARPIEERPTFVRNAIPLRPRASREPRRPFSPELVKGAHTIWHPYAQALYHKHYETAAATTEDVNAQGGSGMQATASSNPQADASFNLQAAAASNAQAGASSNAQAAAASNSQAAAASNSQAAAASNPQADASVNLQAAAPSAGSSWCVIECSGSRGVGRSGSRGVERSGERGVELSGEWIINLERWRGLGRQWGLGRRRNIYRSDEGGKDSDGTYSISVFTDERASGSVAAQSNAHAFSNVKASRPPATESSGRMFAPPSGQPTPSTSGPPIGYFGGREPLPPVAPIPRPIHWEPMAIEQAARRDALETQPPHDEGRYIGSPAPRPFQPPATERDAGGTFRDTRWDHFHGGSGAPLRAIPQSPHQQPMNIDQTGQYDMRALAASAYGHSHATAPAFHQHGPQEGGFIPQHGQRGREPAQRSQNNHEPVYPSMGPLPPSAPQSGHGEPRWNPEVSNADHPGHARAYDMRGQQPQSFGPLPNNGSYDPRHPSGPGVPPVGETSGYAQDNALRRQQQQSFQPLPSNGSHHSPHLSGPGVPPLPPLPPSSEPRGHSHSALVPYNAGTSRQPQYGSPNPQPPMSDQHHQQMFPYGDAGQRNHTTSSANRRPPAEPSSVVDQRRHVGPPAANHYTIPRPPSEARQAFTYGESPQARKGAEAAASQLSDMAIIQQLLLQLNANQREQLLHSIGVPPQFPLAAERSVPTQQAAPLHASHGAPQAGASYPRRGTGGGGDHGMDVDNSSTPSTSSPRDKGKGRATSASASPAHDTVGASQPNLTLHLLDQVQTFRDDLHTHNDIQRDLLKAVKGLGHQVTQLAKTDRSGGGPSRAPAPPGLHKSPRKSTSMASRALLAQMEQEDFTADINALGGDEDEGTAASTSAPGVPPRAPKYHSKYSEASLPTIPRTTPEQEKIMILAMSNVHRQDVERTFLLRLQDAVRDHLLHLLRVSSLSEIGHKFPSLTDQEIATYNAKGPGPVIDEQNFRIDFKRGWHVCNFNREASDFFVRHFLQGVAGGMYRSPPIPSRYFTVSQVEAALDSHMGHARTKWKEVAEPPNNKTKKAAREKAKCMDSRRKTLLLNRKEVLIIYAIADQHALLLSKFKPRHMSGDEAETSTDRLKGNYIIIEAEWQSLALRIFLRLLDQLFLAHALSVHGKDDSGGLKRPRTRTAKPNGPTEDSPAAKGLWRNCYNPEWLNKQKPHVIRGLGIIEEDYDFTLDMKALLGEKDSEKGEHMEVEHESESANGAGAA
ncbi:hypothetical protein VTO73DRAFT_12734 [Trametes versicolor]